MLTNIELDKRTFAVTILREVLESYGQLTKPPSTIDDYNNYYHQILKDKIKSVSEVKYGDIKSIDGILFRRTGSSQVVFKMCAVDGHRENFVLNTDGELVFDGCIFDDDMNVSVVI